MAEFSILDGKLYADETFAPGRVWFRCADYGGLPDNTMNASGYHVVYRPLCDGEGYAGHDHVTEAMREDVRALYAAEREAKAAAEARRQAKFRAATAAFEAIPAAAVAELNAINAGLRQRAAGINEGGEGYVPQIGWLDPRGTEILLRHGADPEAVAAALRAVEAA